MIKVMVFLTLLFSINTMASEPGKFGDYWSDTEQASPVPVKTCEDEKVKSLVLEGVLAKKYPNSTVLIGHQSGDKIDVRLYRTNQEGHQEQCLGTFSVNSQCEVLDEKMDAITASGGFERLKFSCHETSSSPQDD